jgi:hypothetical protein
VPRGSRWLVLAFAVGLAAAGAVIASVLAGGRWTYLGAAIGAVTGSFSPLVWDAVRDRASKEEDLRAKFEAPLPQGPARLLDPRRQFVGFVGREDELSTLTVWCENDDAERLRLVTGPGGVGKTRLAVELAARMAKRGWRTERVADAQEAGAIGALRAVSRGRALLVVDYAETRTGLKQMLAALAGEQGDGVRVLLVARSAADWLDQLGVRDPAVWDMIQAARRAELALSPVVAADMGDADIIALAVRAFAAELGVPERAVEIYGDRGPGQRRVLDLHAAALVAVLADPGAGPVRVDIRTVLDELLRHEQHFWYDTAQARGLAEGTDGATPRMVRQVIAAACLLGAATQEEACALLGRVPGMSRSVKVAEWLRSLYPPDPGDTDWLGTLQPDRLAELHTLRELADSPELGQACLAGLDSRQALRAVTLLARASSDYPEAEVLLSKTLPDVADLIVGMRAPAETLTAIFNAIPYPTVILAPAAAALGREITSHLPSGTDQAVRAYWLHHLGMRLTALGRFADALPVTEEAAAIHRGLAAADPDRHLSHLAASLGNLGTILSELGRPADALTATEEAVAIHRELAVTDPGEYLPDLATSLNNLGIRFFKLDRPADALTAEQEAVDIRRDLAAADPGRHLSDLPISLTNLGSMFSKLNRPNDALQAEQEAIEILRKLAAADPDRHLPELAASLANVGITLASLGRTADALPVTEEAVALRRELAAANPDRHLPDLARSISDLDIRLSSLDRPADALTAEQEAVDIRRDLAAADRERYLPDLATSLTNLGTTLTELGCPADALPVTEEAVALLRELAAAAPEGHLPDLAAALSSLGIRFSNLDRPADALTAEQEALEIRRSLAAADPGRYLPDLAQSLSNLAITYTELDRPADTLAAAQEAVGIRRELAAADSGRHLPDLAQSLSNLGITLSELGRPADALPVTEEAAALFRELAARAPQYLPGLAAALSNLGITLSELDRGTDDLAAQQEAVAIRRELATADPDYLPDLARSLRNLAIRLYHLGLPGDALPLIEEAVKIRRRLAAADPEDHLAGLAQSLASLAEVLAALGRDADATTARREAENILASQED